MAFRHITILMKGNWKLRKKGISKLDFQNLASLPHFTKFSSTYTQYRNYAHDTIGAAYKALGLKNNANLNEVKAAYRQLALKWFEIYTT